MLSREGRGLRELFNHFVHELQAHWLVSVCLIGSARSSLVLDSYPSSCLFAGRLWSRVVQFTFRMADRDGTLWMEVNACVAEEQDGGTSSGRQLRESRELREKDGRGLVTTRLLDETPSPSNRNPLSVDLRNIEANQPSP